jgi:hypothetical protein
MKEPKKQPKQSPKKLASPALATIAALHDRAAQAVI